MLQRDLALQIRPPLCYNRAILNEKEYSRLKRQVREEFVEKTKALDMVWQMARDKEGNGTAKPGRKGEVREVVKRAVATLIEVFTQHDVLAAAQQNDPNIISLNRVSVASALRRLAAEGILEVVEAGKGKRATKYRAARGRETRYG